ncbi:hypothetical protein PHYSODRAFT_335230 [Phytophthora sojae]|uniref:Uncharacterized protein n=1 Tax=Phytophthora sojae (strain P6497) TaxID=1094619 RepID=G4ZUH9_PHYSP|nr:hypothetical protein PHYSODRAFT_335230 [Phytophthora sojae]EGZ13453.1 hypothetical protein PHYSODRAFT_335230 [Phytophthora sojae]|eukprot:XP_009530882.1 hypothetical protein PHYSODRAFT_335230 [Phytophthora sojae]
MTATEDVVTDGDATQMSEAGDCAKIGGTKETKYLEAAALDAPRVGEMPLSGMRRDGGGAEAGAGNGGGSLAASGEAHMSARAGSPARKVGEAEETMEVDEQAGTGEDDDVGEEEEEEEESAASSARNSPLRASDQPVREDEAMEEVPIRDPPAGHTPTVTAAISSLLSLDEAVEHTRSGTLPSSHPGPRGIENSLPARHILPPKRPGDGNSYLVGVPAHPLAYQSERYVQEGYGGTEALAIFDGFSAQDLHDLGNLVGSQTELRNNLLRPHANRESPRLPQLEATLNSLLWRRESASVLAQFPAGRFAERLFFTTSLLHRILDRARRGDIPIQGPVEVSPGGGATLQQRYDRLVDEHRFLQMYHQREVAALRAEKVELQAQLENDFALVAQSHLDEENSLRNKVTEAEAKLERAILAVQRLRVISQEDAFYTDRLMRFLNQGGAATRGRWPRLVRPLRHFQRGSIPPAHWVTNITVEAADRPFRMIPPYPGPVDPDMEDDDDNYQAGDGHGGQDGDREEKSEDNPPTPLRSDFPPADASPSKPKRRTSRGSRSGSCPRGMTELSSKGGPVYVQMRPTVHPGSDVLPLSPQTDFKRLISGCAASLPEFVPWSDVRLDVQFVMWMDHGYEEALDILRQDCPAHQYFPKPWLLEMLVKMMYHGTLDDTLWTRHVPETFYKMAAVMLQGRLRSGMYLEEFPPLRNLAEEAAAEMEIVEVDGSSESDDSRDPDYEDKAKTSPSGKSADGPSKAESIDESSSSDSETDEEKPSKTKRNPKRNRVQSSSDSSTEDELQSSSSSQRRSPRLSSQKEPRSPRSKFVLQDKPDRPSSKKNPKKRSRTSKPKREGGKSPLAQKSYEDLNSRELAIIETPSGDIVSWRRRGVGTRFSPKKGGIEGQTPGFPNYAPQQPETKYLVRRWPAVEDEYAALVEKEPWLEMFNNRVKVLYFHRRDQLSPAVIRILDQHTKPEDDEKCDDLTIYDRAQDLHRKRQALHHGVARTFEARIKRLIKAGMPKTMVWEPGFWLYPCKICYLYVVDESTKKDDGTRYTLADQIAMAELEDPGRTQWTTCTDDERLAHVPAKIVDKMLLPEHERVNNWVSTKFQ